MDNKTTLDLVDNVINKISNGVEHIANSVAKVTPDAWKILVHYQRMLAIQEIIKGIGYSVIIMLILLVYKKLVYNMFLKLIKTDSYFVFSQAICGAIVLIFSMLLLNDSIDLISNGIIRYNSPDYFAVKELITTITK